MKLYRGFTVYLITGIVLDTLRNTVKKILKGYVLIILFLGSGCLKAQEPVPEIHNHAGNHKEFEFDHPLFTESISPDTKIRVDYNYQRMIENVKYNTITVGGEFAFDRIFSIEVGFPYGLISPSEGNSSSHTGNFDISFKFANFEFERYGVLLGYGLDFGLPTGSDPLGIGSDHILEVAPFLDAGLKKGHWEWVVYATFGIPTRQSSGENISTELELNASSLYHVNHRLQLLVELNESSTLSGEGEKTALFLSPGVKIVPIKNEHLVIGVGTQISMIKDPDQKTGIIGSVFYHF